jgi:phage host-nuclease inhibitor protein Gam
VSDDQPGPDHALAAIAYRKGDPVAVINQARSNGDDPSPQPKPVTGPILSEARWDGKLARARAHVAVVVVYQRGDHLVIWPHERKRVLLHRRPVTMYEIDLGLHRVRMTADLPSRGYAGSFRATIDVQWRVFDPSAIVRHRVLDIQDALYAALLRQTRSIAREFGLDQVTAAEDMINKQLSGVKIDVSAPTGIEQAMRDAIKDECLGAEYGLWTRAIAHLALDKAATDHNAKMMQLKWAIEEEEAEHRLRVVQNKNQQEIAKERMEIYRKIIAAGDVDRFALRLARNPDDISAITEIIREDQLTSRHDTIEFISHMVESGVVERWEVGDQVREALEWLTDATARVVTDKDHRSTEIDQPLHQRRRGRGQPIEQSQEAEKPEVIVVTAEAVPIDKAKNAETVAEAVIVEENPNSEPG